MVTVVLKNEKIAVFMAFSCFISSIGLKMDIVLLRLYTVKAMAISVSTFSLVRTKVWSKCHCLLSVPN